MCIPCKIIRNAAASAVSRGKSPIPAVAKAVKWLLKRRSIQNRRERLTAVEMSDMGTADCEFIRGTLDGGDRADLTRTWWGRYENILETKEQALFDD